MKLPRLRGRVARANIPVLVAFTCALVMLLGAHLYFLSPPTLLHQADEGYVNAFAWRMVEGRMLPFVDGVSHRGPLMYWAAAVAVWIGSPTSWAPIRVTSMLCGLLTVVFTFIPAWRSRRPLAAAIGALGVVLVFLVVMPVSDGIAYSGEHLLNAFVMPALTCLVIGLDRDRPRPSVKLVALAGALVAMGALSKQLGAVAILPLGLWVLAVAISRPGLERRERRLLPGAFAAGVALPVIIVVLRYLVAGELGTLFYYTVTYNSSVYLAPYSALAKLDAYGAWAARHGLLLAILGPLGVWAAARPIAAARGLRDLPRAYDEHGFVTTVGLGSLALVITSNAALRDFIHYYILVVPWCALLLGIIVENALEPPATAPATTPPDDGAAPISRPTLMRSLVLLPILVVMLVGTSVRFVGHARARGKGSFDDGRSMAVCAFVKASSKPDDALFVWGFSPTFYTACERKPASRYVFTTFVAGFVPWFNKATREDDEARAVPGSRELLIADLEKSRPPIILDNPKALSGDRPMRRYPALAAYLTKSYCFAKRLDGFDVLLRRTDAGACPPGSK